MFGCSQNHAPRIISFEVSPDSVFVSDSVQAQINVEDLDHDSLSYHWECSGGRLIPSTNTELTTWVAPGTSGFHYIKAVVCDDEGLSDSIYGNIDVYKEEITIVDTTVLTPLDSFLFWEYPLIIDWSIWLGWFCIPDTFVSQPITFIVLDENNFNRWKQGQSYDYYYYQYDVNDTAEFKVLQTDNIYFVVEKPGLPQTEVVIRIEAMSP